MGCLVGWDVGCRVGCDEGCLEGWDVGCLEGCEVGWLEGCGAQPTGIAFGFVNGIAADFDVEMAFSVAVGIALGAIGEAIGEAIGSAMRYLVGEIVGETVEERLGDEARVAVVGTAADFKPEGGLSTDSQHTATSGSSSSGLDSTQNMPSM